MYHGYGAVNKDGTRVLCKQNQKCKFASNKPFRKLPQHVNFQIQTRTETIKYQEQRIASTIYVMNTFNQSILKLVTFFTFIKNTQSNRSTGNKYHCLYCFGFL